MKTARVAFGLWGTFLAMIAVRMGRVGPEPGRHQGVTCHLNAAKGQACHCEGNHSHQKFGR